MRTAPRHDGLARAWSRLVARAIAIAILLTAVTSCSITGTSSRSDDELELARNRQRWASAGIHDYEFDFQRMCFCLQEATERVRITVRQDAIVSVVRTRDGQLAGTSSTLWPRVDELFTDVQKQLEQRAGRIEVSYDPTYGYPRSIVVDAQLMAVDGGYSLTAGNLRRLP
ncbi:MAG: DUF6174 domain-containing protein [Gemmatimonadaceae bacterium]